MTIKTYITGIGIASSIGNSKDQVSNSIRNGISGISDILPEDVSGKILKREEKYKFGMVRNFDPSLFFSEEDIKKTDQVSLKIVKVIEDALVDSGINLSEKRVGIILGSAIGMRPTYARLYETLKAYSGKNKLPQPQYYPSCLMEFSLATALEVVYKKYGIKNYAMGLTGICASGSVSVYLAHTLIQSGQLDAVICGSADFFIPRFNEVFSHYKLLTHGLCRPFDSNRDGFQLGEGIGVLLLEKGHDASSHAYAQILGVGMTNDAFHMVIPSPSGVEYATAMQIAIENSQLNIEDIDYIAPVGRGDKLTDKKEADSIRRVFGTYTSKIPINSLVPYTGYCLGAHSIFNLIFVLLQFQNDCLFPIINLETPDKKLGLFLLEKRVDDICIEYALALSSAFAGVNTGIVLKNTRRKKR